MDLRAGRDRVQRRVSRTNAPAHFEVISAQHFSGSLPPLPKELNSFVGREVEIRQLRELLLRTRLLTLTGAGGVGKTRLALRLAAQLEVGFRDGVILIELAPIEDAQRVAETAAALLGVDQQPGREILAGLIEALRDARGGCPRIRGISGDPGLIVRHSSG